MMKIPDLIGLYGQWPAQLKSLCEITRRRWRSNLIGKGMGIGLVRFSYAGVIESGEKRMAEDQFLPCDDFGYFQKNPTEHFKKLG